MNSATQSIRSGGSHAGKLLFVLMMLAGMPAFAQAPANPQHSDAIQSYLQPLIDNHTLAGAVTLVATRDRIVYVQPVGYRDIAAKAAMPADAMFWIASTSKPMTVTAFMMLVDEGKVSLDDPVEKYLPEFHGQMVKAPKDAQGSSATSQLVPANHPILIREILSHTSGLPFKSAAQPGALDTLSLKDSVRSFAAEPLLFQPGTSWSYSNEGIDTAGRIIEVVTGMPYEKFMQQRLFFPLGMKDTTFWPNPEQLSRLAQAYTVDAGTKDLVRVPISQLTYPLSDRQHRFPMPAGGLFSTAADVSTFCQMILNGGTLDGKRYVSPASLHAMTSVENGGMEKHDYGFGWGISKTGFGHGGADKNEMDINATVGRIFIFMVQQDGKWGTADGDAMVPALEKLADNLVPSPAQPSFDVASVRPSQREVGPDYNNQIAYTPDGFTGRNVTLKRLIAEAWHCQLDQIQGPPWLNRSEFDVVARMPEGTSREQVSLMLRSLLTDRFHLKLHNETREMRVYELTVGPSGPRIHPIGAGAAAPAGSGFHFQGDMRQFADLLALQFSFPAANNPTAPVRASGPQIPVLDKTGLQGTYDFNVDMRPELGTDGFTGWKRALEDQLGLKIDSQKDNVEVLMVDDALKIPTAN